MAKWTDQKEKEEQREALAAVSTLKRAMGIQNHPDKKDEFRHGSIHIYTPDSQSAELIGELMFRYGNGKNAKLYDSRPERFTIRDSIRVNPIPEGGYEASMMIIHESHFAEKLLKMLDNTSPPIPNSSAK